jgi:hypothetical protein
MQLDIEDVIAGAIGSVIGRVLLFCAAVWLGCSIGAAGMIVGEMIHSRTWDVSIGFWIWASPLLIFSVWWPLNIPFVFFALIHFIRSESAGCRAWGVIVGVESLAVMAGWTHVFVSGWIPLGCAWLAWAVLLAMLETGVWSIPRMCHKRWACELEALHANHERRRVEVVAAERERILQEKEC